MLIYLWLKRINKNNNFDNILSKHKYANIDKLQIKSSMLKCIWDPIFHMKQYDF